MICMQDPIVVLGFAFFYLSLFMAYNLKGAFSILLPWLVCVKLGTNEMNLNLQFFIGSEGTERVHCSFHTKSWFIVG